MAVDDFPAARKPAYKLQIDFGSEIGLKKSSAQTTKHYTKEQLMNRLVVAVVNFLRSRSGPTCRKVLTLGVPDSEGAVVSSYRSATSHLAAGCSDHSHD
jgi:tRNA-binding protein